MNFKKILTLGIAASAITFTACGNKENSTEKVKQNGAQPVAATTTTTASFAYVDMDSLQAKYQFSIDAAATLESKMKAYHSTAAQKQNNLQQAQQTIQKKLQDGSITSEEQYKAEVEKYSKQEQSFAQYCQQQEQALAAEQAQLLVALQDSLNNYLEEYNQAKKYTLILNKAVILHATDVTDVTNEVVAGLNNRYQKKK